MPFEFVPDSPESAARPRNTMRIGELLVSAGVVTGKQLEDALAAQMRHGGKLAKTLIALGYLDMQTFIRVVAKEAGVGIIDLLHYDVRNECIDLVPREVAVRHELLPVEKIGHMLTVAMVYPLNTRALYEVEDITGLKARPVMCTPEALWYTIKRHYPQAAEAAPASIGEDDNLLWLERQAPSIPSNPRCATHRQRRAN